MPMLKSFNNWLNPVPTWESIEKMINSEVNSREGLKEITLDVLDKSADPYKEDPGQA